MVTTTQRQTGARTARYLLASFAFLLVSGCTSAELTPSPSASEGTSPDVSPSASASPGTSQPDSSPSPGASPDEEPVASGWTCDNLLSEEYRARIAAAQANDGLVFREDYGQAMIDEGNVIGRFVELGGVACLWGYPDSDNVAAYGYSEIDAQQAADVRTTLEAQGLIPTGDPATEPWCSEYGGCVKFGDGEWFYGSDPAMLEMIEGTAAQL